MWAHVVTAALGFWVIAAPGVFGYGDPAQTNDHIVGPLVATFAVIAWWQVTRGMRWVNVLLGVWLIAAPWVLGYDAAPAQINSVIAGAAIAALSLVRGKRDKPFGGGWGALIRSNK